MLAMTVMTPAAFIGFSSVTIGILAPQPVVAAGLPTFDAESFIFNLKEVLFQVLEGVAKVGIKAALKNFLKKLAYDSAVWIASGGKGQKPLVHIEDVGTMLKNAFDAEIGTFLNGMAEGMTGVNLCEFSPEENLQLQLILPQIIPQASTNPEDVPKPDCAFSGIVSNFKEQGLSRSEQFAALREDPNFYVTMATSLEPGANPLSSILTAADEAMTRASQAQRAAEIEREKSDFKDKNAPISGYIQTPSAAVETQYNKTVNDSTTGEEVQQDNIFADAISTFVNTLAKKLLERVTSGLFDFFTDADIGSSLAGESSPAGASAGVKGASEKFAELKTPAFTNNVQIDILTQMAACPEQGADVTNCVIDSNWRLAIEEQMTVQQAIEQNVIDPAVPFGVDNVQNPSEGVSIRNIEILKQYNVVPVTWLLAVEYMRDFDGTQRTLAQMLDAYGRCTPEDYSPYCGLVDPNWVLKAPDVLCKVQGFGETVINDTFVNNDGSPYTPDERLIARLDSCLDAQTCLTENDEGECLAYGYCTKQEDIYRFEGDSCPVYQASCEQFKDEDNRQSDWLLNTLNFGDCSLSNVGCQWRCGMFNTVDQAFQCAGENQVYPTCTTSGGCGCTANSESCTIAEGGFQCTTASDTLCHLSPVAEASVSVDAAITFDNDVRSCGTGQVGCTEFIPVKGEANLLFNGDAQQFNTYRAVTADVLAEVTTADDTTVAYDDTFAFDVNGQPCSAAAGGPCYGWELDSGTTARAVEGLFGEGGAIAMQVNPVVGGLVSHAFNTGQPLENRTFTLRFAYLNPTGADCTGEYWVRPDGASEPAAVPFTYAESDTFNIAESTTVTIPDGVSTTTVRVGFVMPAGCTVALDGVKLEENSFDTAVTGYGESPVTLNVNKMNSCTVDDIGCELFTPKTGESDLEIPGKITNPLSEACTGPEGFANPLCSQCPADKVGCDAFIEVETPYNAPIKDIDGFSAPATVTAATADAIAGRTGFYCDGTTTACNSSADCGAGVLCLPSISLQPSTADKCTATNVGCEEYVNLDTVAAGGEGKEYYKFIKQCVKPTTDQYSNNEIETYFTWEGSDQTGYQLRSWELKKSNVDAGPCTNLDLYDVFASTTQTPEAKCVDNVLPQATCTAADVGVDPDCTEYFDETGSVFYRLRSATITASEECVGMRNSLDERVYYTIPSESQTCAANASQCREYRGSEGGNVQMIVNENFDQGVWFGGFASSEVITANRGSSMAMGDGTIDSTPLNPIVTVTVGDKLDVGDSYVASFWAKTDNTGPANQIVVLWYSPSVSGFPYQYFEGAAALTNEWQEYTFGPFIFENEPAGDEAFGFEFPVGVAYIDNVELRKSDSQYLIKGSFETCVGYEGCEQYTDGQDTSHTLKSFERLCTTDVVGCQALINTNNNDEPYPTTYNNTNEFSVDDVFVGVDSVVTYAVNDNAACQPEFAGCSVFGTPTLDAVEAPTKFEQQFLVNDPDDYPTALCEEQQRSCAEYTNSANETVYVKNPGSKQCTYNASEGKWIKPDGSDCPLQNPNDDPSQPKGPICNGGLRVGQLCTTDSDCPETGGGEARCVSNANNESGWAGVCLQNFVGCRLYTDPNTPSDITNYSFESDVVDNDDVTAGSPDDIPDNWFDFNEPLEVSAAPEEQNQSVDLSRLAEASNLSTLFGAPVDAAPPPPALPSNALVFQNVTTAGVTSSRNPDSVIGFYNSIDIADGNPNRAGYISTSGSYTDTNTQNPSSPAVLMVGIASGSYDGLSYQVTFDVTTYNTSVFNSTTTSIVMPVLALDAIDANAAVMAFYVDVNGDLYWADSDHDGLEFVGPGQPYADTLTPAEAMTAAHLVDTSLSSLPSSEEPTPPDAAEEPEEPVVVGAALNISDVTDMSESGDQNSWRMVRAQTQSDFETTYALAQMASVNSTGFSDVNTNNPASPEPLIVRVSDSTLMDISSERSIIIETDNSTVPAISVTLLPADSGDFNTAYAVFYVDTQGNMYYADSGANGIETDNSDFIPPEQAIVLSNLYSTGSIPPPAVPEVGGSPEDEPDSDAMPIEPILGNFVENGFADTLGNDVIPCGEFTQSDAPSFDGVKSLKLVRGSTSSTDSCMVGPEAPFVVDPNKTYTLSANVYPTSTNKRFAVGLLYYDVEGNELFAGNDPENYAIAAFAGPNRHTYDSASDELVVVINQWNRFHAAIGPNLEHSFPFGTAWVRVFIEAGTDGSGGTFFDNINFSENTEYTYIADTVDGAPGSDTNSCNGEVNIGNGCVAFRDVLNDSLSYTTSIEAEKLANADFSTEACTFNSPIYSEACDSRADTADSNTVIKVRSDRQCAEWLSCSQARIITDENGTQFVTCFDVNLCSDRNPDTGVCNEWAIKKNSNFMQDEDQVRVNLLPGGSSELSLIQNMTGYARAGAIWAGVCVQNTAGEGSCVGGAAAGDTCSQNPDCSVGDYQIVNGYYPFHWMPQRGMGTAGFTTDVIADGDFENVTCSGVGTYDFEDDPIFTNIDNSTVQAKRDRSLKCTIDKHCRTTETDAEMQSIIQQGLYSMPPNADINSPYFEPYEAGWCANVTNDQWSTWVTTPVGLPSDAEMYIIDYDPELEYDVDISGSAVGVDLNNVLRVEPSGVGVSGVQTGLGSTQITEDNSYTVSFNAQYLENPNPDNDTVTVTLSLGSTSVDDQATINTIYQQYAVGPFDLPTTNEESPTATLRIEVADGNATPFVLDNVSIKPTLEVRTNDNGSSELVARECRGYPESASTQCNYTTNNGTIFQGWKGYCLEHDNLDPSRCVAWWPVDVISGEADSTPRNRITYAGTYPAYQCLVAKGNAALGVCSNDGTICSENSDCNGSATCQGGLVPDTSTTIEQSGASTCLLGGVHPNCALVPPICMTTFIPTDFSDECDAVFAELPGIDNATDCIPSWPPSSPPSPLCLNLTAPMVNNFTFPEGIFSQHELQDYTTEHELSANNYTILHELPFGLYIDRFGSHWAEDDINTEWAVFRKYEPTKLEKSIHISEIEQINYSLGLTQWNSAPDNNAGLSWRVGENNFSTSLLESGSNGTLHWGAYDANDGNFDTSAPDDTDEVSYVARVGMWCGANGNTICDTGSMTAEDINDADLVITKAITTHKEWDNISGTGRVRNNGYPFNPFATFEQLRPSGSVWDGGGIVGEIIDENALRSDGSTYTFTPEASWSSYFFNRYSTDEDETYDTSTTDNNCWDAETCGANVMAVKFDFEDGYLNGIYLIYWNGLERFDVRRISGISWAFYLREPCLLAVESANSLAQARPWQTRIQPDSTYQVRDLGYTFTTNDANAMFGTIRNSEPPMSTLTGFDGKVNVGRTNFTAIAEDNVPMIQPSPTGEQGSAIPYACIGNCSAIRCENPTSANYGQDACGTNGAWKGFDGVCSLPDGGNAELCNDDSDCSNSSAVCNLSVASGAGVDASYSTYSEQLAAAADSAWDRYKLLFVDLMQGSNEEPTHVWYSAQKGNTGDDTYRHQGQFSGESKQSFMGGILNEFATIPQCSGESRAPNEYCYFRPDVDNIRINDNDQGDVEITSGSTVTLTFDSFVDPDQEPITTIAIDWLGEANATTFASNAFIDAWEAASTYGHTYTNVYTCDPTNGDIWNSDKQACEFKLKIRIRDNWDNCSGTLPDSGLDDRGSNCNSFDQYDGTIYVGL